MNSKGYINQALPQNFMKSYNNKSLEEIKACVPNSTFFVVFTLRNMYE